MMRRWLGRLLPLVAITLLVQLIAPIGALRAVALAISDPLSMAPICSGLPAGADDRLMPVGTVHPDGRCCAFCAAAQGGTAALAPPTPAFVVLHRQHQRPVWPRPIAALTRFGAGSHAQARAPPIVS